MYITLLGRSNVGKSSLFNVLISQGGRLSNIWKSIVSDTSGTTRDAKYGHFYMYGNRINVIDTGDVEHSLLGGKLKPTTLMDRLEGNIMNAIKKSQLILFILDGKDGVTPLDVQMCNKLNEWLSALNEKPEIKLVINKLENEGSLEYYEAISDCLSECYTLNLGDPIFVSALQKRGINEIKQLIKRKLKRNYAASLEEMAITSSKDVSLDSLHEFYLSLSAHGPTSSLQEECKEEASSKEGEVLNCPEPSLVSSYGDLVGDDFVNEVDQSLRVCSSVKEAYRPNHKWIRLLDNICGYTPFTNENDDKYITPMVLTPAERLARLYIPKETSSKGISASPTGGSPRYLTGTPEGCSGEEVLGTCDTTAESVGEVKYQGSTNFAEGISLHEESLRDDMIPVGLSSSIEPLEILVLSTAEVDRDLLMRLLTGEELISTGLTVNWNPLYTVLRGKDTIQVPIEFLLSAPLNIRGSLGKMSIKQTRLLLNKCDFVLFCVKYNGFKKGITPELSLTKREISWLTKSVRLNKPIIIIVLSKIKAESFILSKNHLPSYEFESIPIIPIIVPFNQDNIKLKENLHDAIISLSHKFKQVIDTNTLNSWLRTFVSKWPPPWFKGSKVNLKFASQIKIKPPTFLLWSNIYATFPQHYLRQLKAAISDEFNLKGIPIKIILKTTFNKQNDLKGRRKFIRA